MFAELAHNSIFATLTREEQEQENQKERQLFQKHGTRVFVIFYGIFLALTSLFTCAETIIIHLM